MSIASSIRAKVMEHQRISKSNTEYKMKYKQEQDRRVMKETIKANADRKIADARKYGTGLGGAIAKAKEQYGQHKKSKAKVSMGLQNKMQKSQGIQFGVNSSAFELGSGGRNATSPFDLGGGGDKSFLELGNKKKK